MTKLYKLTKQEIGEAIVEYIGKHHEGSSFFPFHISRTEGRLYVPENVTFHLEFAPRGSTIVGGWDFPVSKDYSHNL